MPGKVMHADTSKFEKIETRFYKINFFSNVAKAALLLHSHEKVSALLLVLAIKHSFLNTLKMCEGLKYLGFWINFYLQ